MTQKRLRFGVQAGRATDVHEFTEAARRWEDQGYCSLLMPDHVDRQWGPLTTLAVLADRTSRMRLGPLVLNADFRNPVVLFKELATLDLIAGGRLEIGFGAGWLTNDYRRSGIEFEPAAVRIRRLAEYVRVLRLLWREPQPSWQGDFFHFEGARAEPRPPSAEPTVVLGGGGRQMLTLAAREADIVGVSATMFSGIVGPETGPSSTAESFRRRRRLIDETAPGGIDAREVQCLTFAVTVTDERAQVIDQRLAPMLGLPPAEAAASPLALAGDIDQLCDLIEQHSAEFGINYWVVHGPEADAFAPVVDRLAGRPVGSAAPAVAAAD